MNKPVFFIYSSIDEYFPISEILISKANFPTGLLRTKHSLSPKQL